MRLVLLALAALPLAAAQSGSAGPGAVTAVTSPATSPPAATTTAPAAPTTTAPATPTTTAPPKFVWQVMPTATVCADVNVMWALQNVDPAKFKVDIYAFNADVDQSIPAKTEVPKPPAPSSSSASAINSGSAATPTTTSSARPSVIVPPAAPTTTVAKPAKRVVHVPQHVRNLAEHYPVLLERANPINSSVVKGQPANNLYKWNCNVPPGRYRLLAIVNDDAHTWAESTPFTVASSSNTSCVDPALLAGTRSTTTSGSSSSASPTGTKIPAAAGTKKTGLSGGAIAGIVIGVLAALVLAILAFIFLRRAKRMGRDRGGREPHTPMRNLISKPANFRKPEGNGHALGVMGAGAAGERRMSNRTSVSDNPFETAPSTPIEEKTALPPSATSSFGDAAAVPFAGAGAAGVLAARSGHDSGHAYNDAHGYSDARGFDEQTTPTPLRQPPPAPLTHVPAHLPAPPHVAASAPLTPTTPVTPVPLTPGTAGTGSSHASHPSVGSESHPPSSYPATATMTPAGSASPQSAPRGDRKNSLRRKPVPRLGPEAEVGSADSHGSGPSSGQPLEVKRIGGGPAGDEFGLNAALDGIGLHRGQSFKLMPDPPLRGDE